MIKCYLIYTHEKHFPILNPKATFSMSKQAHFVQNIIGGSTARRGVSGVSVVYCKSCHPTPPLTWPFSDPGVVFAALWVVDVPLTIAHGVEKGLYMR